MGKWHRILKEILGDKTSMKEDKILKRAVKAAANSGTFVTDSKADLQASLQSFFAVKGSKYGFSVEGGRVLKHSSGSAPEPAEPPNDPKTMKKKNKKKKRGDKEESVPHRSAAEGPSRGSPGQEVGDADHERPKKKRKKDKSQEDSKKKKKKRKKYSKEDKEERNEGAVEAGVVEEEPLSTEEYQAAYQRAEALHEAAKELPSYDELLARAKYGTFSSKEKETLRQAVLDYAVYKGLSRTDFSWLIFKKGQRRRDKLTSGMWRVITAALPHRNIKSVAMAAYRIFHPNARKGKWSASEDEQLMRLAVEMEQKWSDIGVILGRTGDSCKDRWNIIKLGTGRKLGHWTQEEDEQLRQVVLEYMTTKREAQAEDAAAGKSRTRMDMRWVLDDVDWTVVAQKIGNRTADQCMGHWYDKVCPSMVERGEWGEGDDRRLLRSLWRLQPEEEYEVPWDQLVKDRTQEQVRRRWRLMVKEVPEFREKEFFERIEWLVKKYFPHWLGSENGDGREQQEG